MSQRLASPTAVELVYGAIEAAPFPEQPKVVDLVAGDCCVKNNNLPVAAPHPTTSHHSTHTGATPDAHQTTPEELAAAALLSVPPRSSPVKKTDAPSTGGTRSSSDKKPDPSSAGGNEAAGALAAPAAAGDSYIALHASQKQRTNWGQWPLGTDNQALLLTKFQTSSGQISVPAARATAILGNVASSGTVSIHCPSLDRSFTVDLRRYTSQPTQVFLVRLKQFFSAASARGGDVLALSLGSAPGTCLAEIWHAEDPRAKEFKAHLQRFGNPTPESGVAGIAAASMAAKTAAVRAAPPAPAADAGEGSGQQQRRTSARLSRPPAQHSDGGSSAGWSEHTHTVSHNGSGPNGGGSGDATSSRLRKRQGAVLAELSDPAGGLRENRKRRAPATTVAAEDAENAVMVHGEVEEGPKKARRSVRRGTGAAAQFRPPRRAEGAVEAMHLHTLPRASDRVLRSAAAEQAQRRLRRKGHPQRSPEGEPNLQAYAAALLALGV